MSKRSGSRLSLDTGGVMAVEGRVGNRGLVGLGIMKQALRRP
jgi:hypothetical protein